MILGSSCLKLEAEHQSCKNLFHVVCKVFLKLCNQIISLLNVVMHETDCQGCLRPALSCVEANKDKTGKSFPKHQYVH